MKCAATSTIRNTDTQMRHHSSCFKICVGHVLTTVQCARKYRRTEDEGLVHTHNSLCHIITTLIPFCQTFQLQTTSDVRGEWTVSLSSIEWSNASQLPVVNIMKSKVRMVMPSFATVAILSALLSTLAFKVTSFIRVQIPESISRCNRLYSRNALSLDQTVELEVMALRASEIKKVLSSLNANTKGLYDKSELGKLLIKLELESLSQRWIHLMIYNFDILLSNIYVLICSVQSRSCDISAFVRRESREHTN